MTLYNIFLLDNAKYYFYIKPFFSQLKNAFINENANFVRKPLHSAGRNMKYCDMIFSVISPHP